MGKHAVNIAINVDEWGKAFPVIYFLFGFDLSQGKFTIRHYHNLNGTLRDYGCVQIKFWSII